MARERSERASGRRQRPRERRSRRKRAPAPDPEARPHEGVPTGTTENERRGGAVGFEVALAVGADCCGALGCHETDELFLVERDGEQRVLCDDHARRWSA
ncbi:hypothetical protein [Halobium salinum]|uniref:hypothetical protein n=1 Tax=Halobium salinum TaxID=1364940 RepID=UPI002271432D|nr:hypothetical protein [Halobium salinum]